MRVPGDDEVLALPDAAALSSAAAAFKPAGQKVRAAVTTAQRTWQGLGAAGVFETPQTAEVLSALAGPGEVAAIVLEQCTAAARALDEYASNLQVLATVRSGLLQALAAERASESQVVVDTPEATTKRVDGEIAAEGALKARVLAFNDAARQADDDCAAALKAVRAYSARTLRSVVLAAESGNKGVTDGLAAAAKRARTVPVLDLVGGVERPEGLPASVAPRYEFGGTVMVVDPADPSVLVAEASLPWWKRLAASHVLVPEAKALEDEVMPEVAVVGKAIGIAGIGLTATATFVERDEELEVDRPDMPLWQRWVEDARTTLIVGGATVVGAYIGGTLVGIADAAVGFGKGVEEGAEEGDGDGPEGGAAGGLIGGFIGGAGGLIAGELAGGVLGGDAGEQVGRAVDGAHEAAVDDGVPVIPHYDHAGARGR